MIHSILSDKATRLFLVLAGFFAANALLAEILGNTDTPWRREDHSPLEPAKP